MKPDGPDYHRSWKNDKVSATCIKIDEKCQHSSRCGHLYPVKMVRNICKILDNIIDYNCIQQKDANYGA
jgi:hypothetical protein